MVATTGQAYAYTGDDPVNDTDPNGDIQVAPGGKPAKILVCIGLSVSSWAGSACGARGVESPDDNGPRKVEQPVESVHGRGRTENTPEEAKPATSPSSMTGPPTSLQWNTIAHSSTAPEAALVVIFGGILWLLWNAAPAAA
jgi:hypothetical protein